MVVIIIISLYSIDKHVYHNWILVTVLPPDTAKSYHICHIWKNSSDVIAISLLLGNRLEHACLSISDTGITVFISISGASYMLRLSCVAQNFYDSGLYQASLEEAGPD